MWGVCRAGASAWLTGTGQGNPSRAAIHHALDARPGQCGRPPGQHPPERVPLCRRPDTRGRFGDYIFSASQLAARPQLHVFVGRATLDSDHGRGDVHTRWVPNNPATGAS